VKDFKILGFLGRGGKDQKEKKQQVLDVDPPGISR
jgi:hypothetical protein